VEGGCAKEILAWKGQEFFASLFSDLDFPIFECCEDYLQGAREGRLTLIRYASANANLFEYGQPFFQVCDQIVDVLDSYR
jgi:hypothetical protein